MTKRQLPLPHSPTQLDLVKIKNIPLKGTPPQVVRDAKNSGSEKKTPAVLEQILLVVSLGLMPPTALSVWMMYKVEGQKQQRVVSAMEILTPPMMRSLAEEPQSILEMPPPVPQIPSEHHYIEGIGLLIGDVTCYYNARSAYIRCAVNPEGPCENCPHYQPTEDKDWKH